MKNEIKLYFLWCIFIFAVIFFHGFERLWNYFYDSFMMLNLKNQSVSEDIVIIWIDKETSEYFWEVGNWNRSRYQGLLEEIMKQEPKVIAFDSFFSSKNIPENFDWDLFQDITRFSTGNIDMMYRVYEDHIYDKNYISNMDKDFWTLLAKSQNVILPYSYKTNSKWNIIKEYDIYPIDVIAQNAHLWYVNISAGNDGVIRYREQNLNNTKSFSHLIAEKFIGKNISLANNYFINYFSLPYTDYTSIQFHKAYNGIFYDYHGNKIDLKDKIVLIGVYDEHFWDAYKTPISKDALSPGVEIIANEVQSIVQNRLIYQVSIFFEIIILFFVYTGVFFALFSTKKFSYLLGQMFAYLVLSFFIVFELFKNDIYFDFKNIFFTLFISYIFVFLLKMYKIYTEKQKIKVAFSRYMDKKIVENILTNESQASSQKMVSILFLDIEWFTDMSEKLTPKELVKITNKIFSAFNDVILENNGTIDKYIWDSIMVFWDETHNPHHAFLACKTAIELQKALKKINTFLEKKINIRIWVNTWEVIIGSIGDENFSDYTILWDHVNLASRLEWINKYYTTRIIISENTFAYVKNNFQIRELDNIKVKGKENGVKIYEVFHSEKHLNPDFFVQHQKALHLYYQKKFEKALKIFEKNYSLYHDEVAKIFIERIHQYQKNASLYNPEMIFEFHLK